VTYEMITENKQQHHYTCCGEREKIQEEKEGRVMYRLCCTWK